MNPKTILPIMNEIDISLFQLPRKKGADFVVPYSSPQYHIILFRGEAHFSLDFTEYVSTGDNTILFFTPYQTFLWLGNKDAEMRVLTFHGDFYCIEYHKKEVACNGLLFNNIYLYPHVSISDDEYNEFLDVLGKMEKEITNMNTVFSGSILKAYLQLLLALCSREKTKQLEQIETEITLNKEMTDMQYLLDAYFLTERSVSFYASQFALSPSAFTKKTRQFFGKTPTQLIQDRVILEAKKMLHLTYKPVKEIASILNFDDEFYFSRYFKKNVGLSPLHYREQVGISIVAK